MSKPKGIQSNPNSVDNQILLQTKLHQPRITADLVHRPRLKEMLDSGLDYSLVLVAAPAGFGKSTLLSAWLETCHLPHAWISLDEADNDFGVFLAYFLGAMQTIFPDALPQTRAFLTAPSLPAVGVIARSLTNELDGLGRDFILVLDDYHLIHNQSVHELLSLLLQHPPPGMRLMMATRRDPLLPLNTFRARHQVAEIRGQHLRFSRVEIAAFVERALGVLLADEALTVLAEKTEGWAAGLRLATLTLRNSGDVNSHLAGLHAENRYVTDYLMQEVLAQVPVGMRDFLLKTAILDRMCGPLGQAVIGLDDPECKPQEYLAWLEQANMFTMALDSRGEWYRYHHLFQDLLRDELTRQFGAAEIDTLHARAGAWFAQRGFLEEALHHMLLGHDTPAAVRLLAEHRHELMASERWQLHERALRMFPAETVAQYPELMLMAAQIACLKRTDWEHYMDRLDQAESLLAQIPDQPEHAVHLQGEIDALRSLYAYETATDPESAITFAQRALANTPRAWYYVRSHAWLYLAVAYQAIGQLDRAYAVLAKGQPEDVAQNGAVYARLAGSRCFVDWIAGDLQTIPRGAHQILAVAKQHKRPESLGWAHYLLSSVAYERNDLATAEAHATAAAEMRYLGRSIAYLQSAFIYASICQARGQADQAQRKIEMAFEFLSETSSEGLVPLAQAFQAELAARQGDLGAARHWATTIGPFLPLTFMPYFYVPQLTLPKILLAQNTPASRKQAAEVLSRLHNFVTSTHNTRFTIEVLALQALLHEAQGDKPAALALLQQAVVLAEPGGFIRLFVDLGPQMASLLTRLRQTGVLPDYTGQILQAVGESTPAALHSKAVASAIDQTELVEPLTRRQHEILTLLSQRLTNNEIAEALVISPLTVKRHAATIYQKLQVKGRREAVAKATRLGLL